jgi:cation/acetate symporter
VWGLAAGLFSSIGLILVSPSFMGVDGPEVEVAARRLFQIETLFPLRNPGIISIPLGFLAAFVGSLVSREPSAEEKYTELIVRAHTGLGAEKASRH